MEFMYSYSLGSHRSQAVPERRVVQTHFWTHARLSECLEVSSGFFRLFVESSYQTQRRFVNPFKAAVVLSKECLSCEFPLPLGLGIFSGIRLQGW